MSLGKRLINTGAVPACTTDSTDPFGDSSGVALYNLDYDASTAPDGTDYSGSPSNVTFGVGGQINYGARFNGSSSHIATTTLLPTNNFTFSCWVNPNSFTSSANKVIYNQNITNNRFYISIFDSGKIEAWNGSSTFTTSSSVVNLNQWHNIVYTADSTNGKKIYVDGVEVLTTSNTGNNQGTASGTNWTGFGKWYTNILYLDGDLDQVRIFSKALNQTEVDTLYAETACVYTSTTDIVNYPTGTTPVAYYKLDNSSEDYSTGGNDGTETDIEYRFGRFGQAAVFNGSSSKITAPSILSSSYTGSVSYSAWFKTSNTANTIKTIIVTDDTTGSISGKVLLLAVSYSGGTSGLLELTGYNFPTFSSFGTTNVADGNWHNVIVVLDNPNATLKVYLDGNSSPEITKTLSSSNITLDKVFSEDWTIGSQGTIRFFDGSIDQVRIYSTALTSSQVTELYNEKPEVDTSNFKTVLYEGTGASQYISNVGMDLETSGGLVWLKARDDNRNNRIFDSVRGATKRIYPDIPNAEGTESGLDSFEANGFFLGSVGGINANNESFVAWNWKAGGDAVTDSTTGDLTADISANTESGFSIVNFTGVTATPDGVTVPHGLNSAPELVILKPISVSGDWQVYAYPVGNNKRLKLNDDSQATTTTGWDNTHPDSNNVTMEWSSISKEYIMYCWHSVAGYSKIGSYTGDSSSTVPVTTNFRPSLVIIKNTDTTSTRWVMYYRTGNFDSYYNYLFADDILAEQGSTSSTIKLAISDTGFTVPVVSSTWVNNTGDNYLYMAFK